MNTKQPIIASLLLFLAGAVHAAEKKPNIIFFLVDDAAYRDFSCLGQKQFSTPNIDRLAREGRVFQNAYSGGSWCAPSRSCLLTGMNTAHLNALERDAKGVATKLRPTVAEMLKSAGYATAVVGKWHTLDDNRDLSVCDHVAALRAKPDKRKDFAAPPAFMPWNRGFDVCRVFRPVSMYCNFPPFIETGAGQTVAVPENQGDDGVWLYKNYNGILKPDSYDKDGYYVTATGKTSATMFFGEDYIRREARNFIRANKDRPFFLYYATQLTHRPLVTKSLREFKDKPGWSIHHKALAAMTLEVDDSVGVILDELKQLHLEEQTLIVFASDNGYTAGLYFPGREIWDDDPLFQNKGPWLAGKHCNADGGVAVPFIVWGPGRVTPGKTDRAVCFSDFMSTASELTGAKLPGPTDGISFVPLLQGRDNDQPTHPAMVWTHESCWYTFPLADSWETNPKLGIKAPLTRIDSTLLDEKWFAVILQKKSGSVIRLFDITTDPGMKHDVAGEHPELVTRAKAEFPKLENVTTAPSSHPVME
jgi:arylsulfatase A-like enzyme